MKPKLKPYSMFECEAAMVNIMKHVHPEDPTLVKYQVIYVLDVFIEESTSSVEIIMKTQIFNLDPRRCAWLGMLTAKEFSENLYSDITVIDDKWKEIGSMKVDDIAEEFVNENSDEPEPFEHLQNAPSTNTIH